MQDIINLSNILPVLSVEETVLMPNAGLPLSIKHEKYKKLQSEIVEGNLLAILHPIKNIDTKCKNTNINNFYNTGCAGKILHIIASNEKINILIQGICRFNIVRFIETSETVERILVDYSKYSIDMTKNQDSNVDTTNLLKALASYCKDINASPNWSEINNTTTDSLVSAIAMSYPLHPVERQSILETVELKDRSEMVAKFIKMNLYGDITNATFN